MHRKKREATYYRIRAELFWGMTLCLLLLLTVQLHGTGSFLPQKTAADPMEDSLLRVEVTCDGWISELTDPAQCFLCGENNRSRIRSYDGLDSIGLISLNDWAVIPLALTGPEEESLRHQTGSGTLYGNTGEITYLSSGDPSRGMARLHVTLPENPKLDSDLIRQNLCQSCLDKITASLRTWKWENEDKEPLPLCLIDFLTLEAYPLQDWYRAYFIRDYWVEMELDEPSLNIKVYYLPEHTDASEK